MRDMMIARWNQYRASEEGRAAFSRLVRKQTLHQGTITAIDQALELAFFAGGVAALEETEAVQAQHTTQGGTNESPNRNT